MSYKELAIDILATTPCRNVLASLESTRLGRKVLNTVSYPRCLFDSFPEAWRACNGVTYAGHDHPDYLRYHTKLAGRMRVSDYAVLYWLSRIPSSPLRILDFGGNVGNLFYTYANHLHTFTDRLDWVVFDLPKTVEAGLKMAHERGESELHFTTSLDKIEGECVILVSSAFHYWEKSVADFIEQFPARPRDVIINRIPVHEKQGSFITVQYKKTFAHPCFVRNSDELVADFRSAGYALVDRWQAPELALRMPLFPGHHVRAYSGFYFSSRKMTGRAVSPDVLEVA